MSEKSDELALALEQIEAWCAEHTVQVIHGYLEGTGQLPEVTFKDASSSSPTVFLKSLEHAPVAAMVIHALRLTREVWQSKIAELEDAETPEGKARLGETQDCEKLIGCVAMIELAAFFEKPQLVLKYGRSAKWAVIFSEDEADFAGEQEVAYEDPRTSPRIEELARRVAKDPRFATAKKQAEQQYIAKTVLRGEKMEVRDIYHIAQQAASIFEFEIKPTLDAALAKQAEKLKETGHSITEIAKRLNLTTREVKRVLG
jgi:hypothetical protein